LLKECNKPRKNKDEIPDLSPLNRGTSRIIEKKKKNAIPLQLCRSFNNTKKRYKNVKAIFGILDILI